MSNSVSPLNISAAALNLLQARGTAATDAVAASLDAEKQAVQLIEQESDALARQSARSSGGAIPRGQFINILV